MKIYLVRHGEYQSSLEDGPLTKKGEADITKLAKFLLPLQLEVSQFLYSAAKRTTQTAEILSSAVKCHQEKSVRTGIEPSDAVQNFIENSIESAENMMVVGHYPFLARLSSDLVTRDENKPVLKFMPGTIACLENYTTSLWTIDWVITPELL